MADWVELCVPDEPECWDSCGTCRSETLTVVELLATEGDTVQLYQPLVIVEAYKTEMEICAPSAGTLLSLHVQLDDEVSPGDCLALISP